MSHALRRQPAQRRGAIRVDQILDACGLVLHEVGYAGLTTRAVAERAGSSIGSFYQFFDGRDGLIAAFGQRNLDRYIDRLATLLADRPPAGWADVVDRAYDEYVAERRKVPGFGDVDFALVVGGEPNASVAVRVGALLAAYTEVEVTEDLQRVFHVAVQAADSVIQLAFRTDPDGDPALLAEGKHVITHYLAGRLPNSK